MKHENTDRVQVLEQTSNWALLKDKWTQTFLVYNNSKKIYASESLEKAKAVFKDKLKTSGK